MRFPFGKSRKLVGIGLDGLPYSLAEKLMYEGVMPNLHKLAERGTMKKIRSVYPTVSGVAWSAFQTGADPSEFGVYGFVELTPDFELYIPNHTHLKCETIWQKLDKAGRKWAALGVPMTYPVADVKGSMVSGFLAPKLDERACSDGTFLDKLKGLRYEIDIDPAVAIESPERFKEDLTRVSEARQKTALALLGQQEWDFFFLHVMDTDRLHHFLWPTERHGEDGYFWDFYKKLDDFLGRVIDTIGGPENLLLCSDHGFCELKWEFQVNRWLKGQGYLDCENDPQKGFQAIKEGSRALALVPGRIHILTESRWDKGVVTPKEYGPLRKELMDKLRAITHPETGEVVCKQVMTREELFKGAHADSAPDILIDPCNGYDLKAKLGAGHLFERGPRRGMHTFDDAMLRTGRNLGNIVDAIDIADLGRRVAKYIT